MWKWTNETRSREVSDEEKKGRASGWHKAPGCFVVERQGGHGAEIKGAWQWAPGSLAWREVSSHDSDEAAQDALKKLNRKIAKEATK